MRTEADWIRAGEIVFNAALNYDEVVTVADVRDPAWHAAMGGLMAKDGTMPWFRYVVREKGKVELGTISCAMCHMRLGDDGNVISGAQANFPFERAAALFARRKMTLPQMRGFERSFFGTPWIQPDPLAAVDQLSAEQIIDWHAAIPAGVVARHGTSPLYPAQISDLIGIRDRKYLDHTGLQLQRSIADLMRYAALNIGADNLASYDGFVPAARNGHPNPASERRFSDEQLYALALYLYSLKAPDNPNKFDRTAKRGQMVFEREGCGGCHTPPLYTNNKLIPVDGFSVPEDHRKQYDVLWLAIGTDPGLALKTRRGTGYYKVPSLKGVWYRGPFEHNGSVATLEDWFDRKRLSDEYVPTAFRGAGVKTHAVKGHEFGLDLSAADRRALIAFLKTL